MRRCTWLDDDLKKETNDNPLFPNPMAIAILTCPLFTRLRTILMFSLGCSTSLATLMLLVEREGAKDLPFLEDLALFECECGLLDDPKNEKLVSY